MLLALAKTGIEVIVSVPNDELLGIGQSSATAANWVTRNIIAHVPSTNITAIAVGSEVLTSLPNAVPVLVFALQFIHSALVAANLDDQIKVSTPHRTPAEQLFLLSSLVKQIVHSIQPLTSSSINVYVADLPKSLDYGLLNHYWSLDSDSRLGGDADLEIRSTNLGKTLEIPPYPENPIIKQYSAEYWIMGDLITPPQLRSGSFAKPVLDARDADVVFVPFFATLSAELQLGTAKGVFRKKDGNKDYQRQREVIDFVKKTQAWNCSDGRDHARVLTGYVKTEALFGRPGWNVAFER